MSQKKNKADWYQMERFSPEQLMQVERSVGEYALAINGMPKNHSEVFEKRGWLTPFLLSYDDLLWGRWNYWTDIMLKNTIEGSSPIPQIEWADGAGVEHTRKMFRECLNHPESNIDHFADWLLWGLGGSHEVPRISPALNKHYYEKFDMFLVQNYPTDYLSLLLCEETGKGYKSGLGYFPTPFNVTVMMHKMVSIGDPETMKRQSVADPCVGCGAMLLPASNTHLRGYGQDISAIAIKLCKIQMYWYAPWFAMQSDSIEGFDESEPVILVPSEASKGIVEGQLALQL